MTKSQKESTRLQCANRVRVAVKRPWTDQCMMLWRSLSLAGDYSIWGIPIMWGVWWRKLRELTGVVSGRNYVLCKAGPHGQDYAVPLNSDDVITHSDVGWGCVGSAVSCWCRVCLDLSGLSLLSVPRFLLFEVEMCTLRDCISKLYDFKKFTVLQLRVRLEYPKTHSLFCIIQAFQSLVFA